MKLLFISLFLLTVTISCENKGTSDVQKCQEFSSENEACSVLSITWCHFKFLGYHEKICPKMHTDDAKVKQCTLEVMKVHFSSTEEMMKYIEKYDFFETFLFGPKWLTHLSLSPSAEALLDKALQPPPEPGEKGQCEGEKIDNIGLEQIKEKLNCVLKVISDAQKEIGCS